jgi:short subunit dehydrogenase-like uncharacterized protein
MRQTIYDVVLYGANGFVGQQTVRYFADRVSQPFLVDLPEYAPTEVEQL